MFCVATWTFCFIVVVDVVIFCFTVYVFLGDYHALIDFVRSLDKETKNTGDHAVITVLDEQPTSKLKHFLKSKLIYLVRI
jgi:hypothetical protein